MKEARKKISCLLIVCILIANMVLVNNITYAYDDPVDTTETTDSIDEVDTVEEPETTDVVEEVDTTTTDSVDQIDTTNESNNNTEAKVRIGTTAFQQTYLDTRIFVDETTFPDEVFRQFVLDRYVDVNGYLTDTARYNTTSISVSDKGIKSLQGIEFFEGIKNLYCASNLLLELDVSHNTKLEILSCYSNSLTSLDISANLELRNLSCWNNSLANIVFGNNAKLTEISIGWNVLTSLDMSTLTGLMSLDAKNNNLQSIDVSNCTQLTELNVENSSNLSVLNINQNTKLTSLNCGNTKISTLDVSHNTDLKSLNCYSTAITALDVSNHPYLTTLYFNNTYLISLRLMDKDYTTITDFGTSYRKKVAITIDVNASYDLKKLDPNINPDLITNVVGAKLNGTMLVDVKPGTTVSYKYLCNSTKELEVKIDVTYAVNAWEQELTVVKNESGYYPTAKSRYGTVSYTYSNQANGTYTSIKPTAAGTYYVKAIVSSSSYYSGLEAIKQFTIDDKECPSVSNYQETNISEKGYTISFSVSDNVGVTGVDVTVSVENVGSKKYTPTISNGKVSITIPTSDFNNATAKHYYATINVFDAAGNTFTFDSWVYIPDQQYPKISNLQVSNVTSKGYTLTFNVSDNVGIKEVEILVEVPNGAKYFTGTVVNGKVSMTINASDLYDSTGVTFKNTIYVSDTSNNKTIETINVEVPRIPTISYRTHVQDYGWMAYVSNGNISGTSGQSKRLEAIQIKIENSSYSGGITYQTHVQDYGWMGYVSNGNISGTSGQSKRLEAIQIKLTGQIAEYYDVYYRVHSQEFGWLAWAKNGEMSGTSGYSFRLEAIEIVLVEKGKAGPTSTVSVAYINNNLQYQTHVQDYGWQSYVSEGKTAGTSSQSKRLEGIRIKLNTSIIAGSVSYQTHVQDYGWQDWKKDGAMSGTSGESKRLEAIRIKLSGEISQYFDIYYRVHCQNLGWLDWAKNGEMAGTSGYAYRLEAIEIRIIPKGGISPSSGKASYKVK